MSEEKTPAAQARLGDLRRRERPRRAALRCGLGALRRAPVPRGGGRVLLQAGRLIQPLRAQREGRALRLLSARPQGEGIPGVTPVTPGALLAWIGRGRR